MRSRFTQIISAIAIMLAIALLSACGEKVHQKTITEWASEVKADAKNTVERYSDGLIEISGEISGIGIEQFGGGTPPEAWITLIESQESASTYVECFTHDQAPWLSMTNGHRVTLRGRVEHRAFKGLVLVGCTLVSNTGGATPSFAPDSLVETARQNPDFQKGPVNGQLIVLTGSIAGIHDPGNYQNWQLTMKHEDWIIECHVPAAFIDESKPFKTGNLVKLLGNTYLIDADAKKIMVIFCRPID